MEGEESDESMRKSSVAWIRKLQPQPQHRATATTSALASRPLEREQMMPLSRRVASRLSVTRVLLPSRPKLAKACITPWEHVRYASVGPSAGAPINTQVRFLRVLIRRMATESRRFSQSAPCR